MGYATSDEESDYSSQVEEGEAEDSDGNASPTKKRKLRIAEDVSDSPKAAAGEEEKGVSSTCCTHLNSPAPCCCAPSDQVVL